MIGKKNVVFGFIFLVFTAALGPYMILNTNPLVDKGFDAKKAMFESQAYIDAKDGMELLDPTEASAAELARIVIVNFKLNAELSNIANVQRDQGNFRNVHAHGNLEALLNIAAGLALCFIAIGRVFKQIISWLFIGGALLHSGMLYLLVLGQSWAATPLQAGPVLVLLALLSIGIAACFGFKGEVVRDD
jgi:hypothetical protein